MFNLNPFKWSKSKRKPTGTWPERPPQHNNDRHFLLNEFDTFGIMQYISKRQDEFGNLVGFDMISVILMENGYGDRYCNILRNGILSVRNETLRDTLDWKNVIQPWLNGDTDHIPTQDGLINAELATAIHEARKHIKS